jgi:nicotinamidase-related amidase
MKKPLSLPPNRAALLCIDLQEEHRQDKRYLVSGFDTILGNVQALQRAARANAVPVLHAAYIVDATKGKPRPFHPVMADGSSAFSDKDNPLSAICPEVSPQGDELLIVKTAASVFSKASLGDELHRRQTEWLVIAGVWTEACIDATVKDAVEQGFRVLLVKDACGSGSVAMHQTGILNLANRLYGGAVTNTAGACRLLTGETVESWMVEGSVPLRYSYENAASTYSAL